MVSAKCSHLSATFRWCNRSLCTNHKLDWISDKLDVKEKSLIYLNLSPSLTASKQLAMRIPSFSFQICFRSASLTPGWFPLASLYPNPTSHSAVTSESSTMISTLTAVVVTFGQYRSHRMGGLFSFVHRDFLQSKNPFNFMLSRSASIVIPSAW